MLNFPELRQTYEYDCGASALQSVLVYFGIKKREEILIKEAKTSKKGTSVDNLEKTLKKYKLKFDSMEMSIKDIKNYIEKGIPVILLVQAWGKSKKFAWKNDWKDEHYVVAIGYDKNKFYFEDPYTFERTFLNSKDLIKRWHAKLDGKKYFCRGIAVYGKKPKFNPKKIVPMR